MLLATLLCYSGFTALCLSMSKHYSELRGARLGIARARLLRLSGWACLALSLGAALASTTLALALVQWCAALMGCALLLVFMLPFWPGLVLALAGSALGLSAWLALIAFA